ncbi:MAG: hypothetical protein KA419_12795 [Acidobacteria bacterium]|nr:hypothetical protein [Acidobacteriota bacterium]
MTTCTEFLTAAQLKEICRFRGFAPPKNDKAALAAFVAPRLPGTAGVKEAMASLDRNSLRFLHLLAGMARRPSLRDIRGALMNAFDLASGWDDRDNYSELGRHILNRGLLLLADDHLRRSGESRYSGLTLVIPESHRPLLPPYPIDSRPLNAGRGADPGRFWLNALSLAASGSTVDEESETPAVNRYAGRIRFTKGRLLLAGAEVGNRTDWRGNLTSFWLNSRSLGSFLSSEAAQAVRHILSHVPRGHGCSPEDLSAELTHHGLKIDPKAFRRFIDDGLETGFLVAEGNEGEMICALAPADSAPVAEDPAALTPCPEGLRIRLSRSTPETVLQLLSISTVTGSGGEMVCKPDLIRIGRLPDNHAAATALREKLTMSPAYAKAFERVREARGKTRVHKGATILKIADPVLRAQLAHHLGDAFRPLGGEFFAVPEAKGTEVEAFARKLGLVPRRVQ